MHVHVKERKVLERLDAAGVVGKLRGSGLGCHVSGCHLLEQRYHVVATQSCGRCCSWYVSVCLGCVRRCYAYHLLIDRRPRLPCPLATPGMRYDAHVMVMLVYSETVRRCLVPCVEQHR